MYSDVLMLLFFLLSEFYGQTHLEAAFIDVILDTLVDMGDKAIPYLLEKDATKKVLNTCKNADKRFPSIDPGFTFQDTHGLSHILL